ncbi:hypothetical protein [Streptomyces sp. 6N223]|uniref:hypothetical protein n=1 Tax=Streptomyces sp. 6N223 TaxID=3457412 RepID=UPI003FD041D3
MLVMVVIGALPQQIEWADGLIIEDGALLPGQHGLADALRLLTVSPTLLYDEHTGARALLHETLWAAVFFTVLLLAASLTARRIATPAARSLVAAIALPVYAPLANVVALALTSAPDVVGAADRGENTAQLIRDARFGAAHALVLGTAGALGIFAATVLASESGRRRPSPVNLLLRLPAALWHSPRLVLVRAGVALMAGCGGLLALGVLTPSLVGEILAPLARGWCGGSQYPETCADDLISGVTDGARPPGPQPWEGRISHVFWRYASVYAFLGFFLSFCGISFLLRLVPGIASHPVTTGLFAWAAYTYALASHTALLEQGEELVSESQSMSDLLVLVVPPLGLEEALLTAPVVAVSFAASHALFRRVRARLPRRSGATYVASATPGT